MEELPLNTGLPAGTTGDGTDSDEFREKVTRTMKHLKKTIKFKEYIENEIIEMDDFIRALATDGVDVSRSQTLLGEAKAMFERSRGLEDYRIVSKLLMDAKNSAHNADLKIQEIIATVDQTLGNIDKFSKLGLEMKKPLQVLAAMRNKLKRNEQQAAILLANQAWSLTEEIHQKFSQINTYLDELKRRYDQCKELDIATDEMPKKLEEIDVHIKANDPNNAYKEMENLTKLLDTAQTEYVNKLIQDAYYDISLQPDIAFTDVQEVLSQAEYAMYNADFFTAIDLSQKTGAMVQKCIKEYQKTLEKVEAISTRIFNAKNLGVSVLQAETIVAEANRMLLASDFKMAEEYVRQSGVELDIMKEEIEWRERSSMENMYANVRNALMGLNSELQQDKKNGVDIVDAENLVERIIEKMDEAKSMDDYKKIQEYISATYSALTRARARHTRKESEKREGEKELHVLREKIKDFERECLVPEEIKKHVDQAFKAYKKGNPVDMKRDVGQIEQFFREMGMKEIDVDINIRLLKDDIRIEDWVPAEITLKNNSNAFIRDISLVIDGVVDQKGFQRIRRIKGQESFSQNIRIRFQAMGQNRLTFNTTGLRAMDNRAFKLREKANIFVGSREELLDDFTVEGAVDWGE